MIFKSTFIALVVVVSVFGQSLTKDNQRIEPFQIADNLYYVGSSDIAVYLLTTPSGAILIDGGYIETAPMVVANVAKLGFHVTDVKILLNTQAHSDHAGGLAELKRLTGARLAASPRDAELLESGGKGDFYFGDNGRFRSVHVDRRVHDAEQVKLNDLVLTAHLTPGHTKGCTTWTFEVTDRGRRYHAVDVCGLTILSGTPLHGASSYPEIARDYKHTYEVLKTLPCEIFLGAHASYYDAMTKAARKRAEPEGPNPFIDPGGYAAFVRRSEQRFLAQLAKEQR